MLLRRRSWKFESLSYFDVEKRNMYSNYFLVDKSFLDNFEEPQRTNLSKTVYSIYRRCGSQNSRKLSAENYFSSIRTQYPVYYCFCPKCKKAGFMPSFFKRKASQGMKFCPACGEPSINYRYETGHKKIASMLRISHILDENHPELSKHQNQQLIVLICSVYEVYLREFYADILNSKFVQPNASLYEKFSRDCKNDFLNPGKTQDRLKRELGLDYKSIISANVYKWIDMLCSCRNVIVHNNGICDTAFVKKNPDIEIHSELAPKSKSIAMYLQVISIAVEKMDRVYQSELLQAVVRHLKYEVLTSGVAIYTMPMRKK